MSIKGSVWRRFFLGQRRQGNGPIASLRAADWQLAKEYARAFAWRRYLRGEVVEAEEPSLEEIDKAYMFLFGGGVISREPVWW